jgi:hypothetical protein
MTREEKIAVVERYIYGLGNGDFSQVPFADDVSYESPLTPKRTRQDAIAFLSALFPIMRGADVQQHIVEGEYVATVFHLRTPNGVTTVFDKFRVVDGSSRRSIRIMIPVCSMTRSTPTSLPLPAAPNPRHEACVLVVCARAPGGLILFR